MSTEDYAVWTPVDAIRPYENNPRDNSDSIAKVAESIRAFGFLQPIVVDGDGVILAGHTRYQAAKRLGLDQVPVLFARDLTPGQAKAYRLADNKVSESSRWVEDMLTAEIEELEADDPGFDLADFGFEPVEGHESRRQWNHIEKRCGLAPKYQIHSKCGFFVTTLFAVSDEGRTLEDIKADPTLAQPFADTACDYLLQCVGGNLAGGGWCLCTTPRRRHSKGFHFASAVCEAIAAKLGVPFYADAFEAHNRRRLNPDFSLEHDPAEHNVILYDDIITTGMTLKVCRNLLLGKGHTVLPLVSIKN